METELTDTTTDSTTHTRTDHNVWVGLSYDDPLAARAWLRELGFDDGILVQDEVGAVQHSEMLWPEGGRVMVSSRARGHDTFVSGARAATVYVVVDDPDAVWQRAQLLAALEERHGGVLGWLGDQGWTRADTDRLRRKLLAD